jgi:outer membrane protein W
MRRLVLLAAFFACTTAAAQEIEAGLRHLIVNTGSTGDLEVPASRGFAGTLEVFITPRFSAELSQSFVNPTAMYRDLDLGTLGLESTALTARWNFAPAARLSAFAGAGAAFVKIGNLDDQFGDEIDVEFDSELAPIAEAGLRLRVVPRLAAVLLVSYMPLAVTPNVRRTNVPLPGELGLDPVTVGVGASWRF